MSANDNQQRAGRQGRGPGRGHGSSGPAKDQWKKAPEELFTISPKLADMLVAQGATLRITSDGVSTMVEVTKDDGQTASLAAFLRQQRSAAESREFRTKLSVVTQRLIALGFDDIDLSPVADEQGLNTIISALPAEIAKAIRMNADNFRAYLRAQNQPPEQEAEEEEPITVQTKGVPSGLPADMLRLSAAFESLSKATTENRTALRGAGGYGPKSPDQKSDEEL